jgi:hypothetical protein
MPKIRPFDFLSLTAWLGSFRSLQRIAQEEAQVEDLKTRLYALSGRPDLVDDLEKKLVQEATQTPFPNTQYLIGKLTVAAVALAEGEETIESLLAEV